VAAAQEWKVRPGDGSTNAAAVAVSPVAAHRACWNPLRCSRHESILRAAVARLWVHGRRLGLTMTQRPCSKVSCNDEAGATLTYVYADSMAVLGPLSYTAEPHSYDLCARHAERLSVPQGWQVVRHVVLGHEQS
jgi:hypothetical protein